MIYIYIYILRYKYKFNYTPMTTIYLLYRITITSINILDMNMMWF